MPVSEHEQKPSSRFERIFDAVFTNSERGEPRLFWRQAVSWMALSGVIGVWRFLEGGFAYPGVVFAIPPAVFLLFLYSAIERWAGGWALVWYGSLAASLATPIALANLTKGDVMIPILGAFAGWVATAAFAEWLRRPRLSARHDG